MSGNSIWSGVPAVQAMGLSKYAFRHPEWTKSLSSSIAPAGFNWLLSNPDYQYSAIGFVLTRTLTQQTYDSTVIEYNNSTGQRTYKMAMPNSMDQHAPFRRLLADHMDILVYTKGAQGRGRLCGWSFHLTLCFTFIGAYRLTLIV
jgi:hypothetical protein